MATGFMTSKSIRARSRDFTLCIAACLIPATVFAQEVGVAGVIGSKALLMINGAPPQSVPVGKLIDGVKVVSIQGDLVVVEIDGRKRPLRVGQHAVGTGNAADSEQIILKADGAGHFVTNGTINGGSIRFLVDTGASMISLGASDARRLGLDFNKGQKGFAQTANGQTMVSKVQLDSVRVAGVTLHQVDAVIHQTELPVALLGMSFLNRMEMQRNGNTMTLKKRY